MYFTLATHKRAFESGGVWGPGAASITGIAQPEEVNTAQISGGVLETLKVPALAGQWLTAADQDPHGLGRVMLSYGYWQRRFGGDRGVVGRPIRVNSQSRGIAGVMPRGFKVVNYDFDLLLPMSLDPVNETLAGFAYRGIARVRPGGGIPQANGDVGRLVRGGVGSGVSGGRWGIARELWVESVTLGLLGGAAGVAVAYGGLRLLAAIGPENLPRLSEISLDGRSIVFTLILSVLTGLLFG